MCRILYSNECVAITQIFFYFVVLVGNTKLEKWSASSLRRAGLCEDHFSEESFTNTRGLKRNAMPIPFKSCNMNVSNEDNTSIPFESYNINENENNENNGNNENNENNVENNEVNKSVKIEQVLHLQQAREQAQCIEKNIASTSFKYTLNENMTNEHM